MKEYIERMNAISVIKRYEIGHCPEYMQDWATKLKRAILDDLTDDMMEATAADVVEVVRCKDCKHIDTIKCPLVMVRFDMSRTGEINEIFEQNAVGEDFGCTRGERRLEHE